MLHSVWRKSKPASGRATEGGRCAKDRQGEAEDDAGGGVQSVERAFEILEVIAKSGGELSLRNRGGHTCPRRRFTDSFARLSLSAMSVKSRHDDMVWPLG